MSDDAEYSDSGVRIHRYESKEKPFQIAEGDAEALEAIKDHIEKHVGKIETVMRELVSDLVHIDVHIVEPAAERNYYTLITSGMSDCCALLASPLLFGDEFGSLRISESKTINFYALLPIYKEEMEFKLTRGGEKLYERFDREGVNELLDINRRNVCHKRFGIF